MSEVNYLNLDDARNLVDRIADRTKIFNYTMSDSEQESMAQLLSDIGVGTSDIINISNLADNYAINAEIVTPSEADQYSNEQLEESLFTWNEGDGTYYCIQW